MARISRAMSIRPRKSGTKTSTLVAGVRSLIALMHSAKCCAPPSLKSSRSTEVITTYLRAISATAVANSLGSSTDKGLGRPWATSQNGHLRVQISPMIIKVAVPWLKHSPKLGQLASSQTDASLCSLSLDLMRLISGELTTLIRNQSGLRGILSVGITLIGMRATLSAPRSLTPASALYDVAMVTYP